MAEESLVNVVIEIEDMLHNCPPSIPSNPSIFRVDDYLRNGGIANYYEPEVVSVGPYHHGIHRLQSMEHHKFRYLKRVLDRRKERTVSRYVAAVTNLVKEARKCYSEPLNVGENAFVKLMVVDGLFLVELFRCCAFKDLRDKDDPVFRHERILTQLRHDICLLENQLPFFVLKQLFHMSKMDEYSDEELMPLFLHFVDGTFLNLSASRVLERLPAKNFDHLCGLAHDALCSPLADPISYGYIGKTNCESGHLDDIKSVSRLQEVGIELTKAMDSNSLMDFKFVNGVLKIPELSIFDETEWQLRNLIAYEQFLPNWQPKYVSDYIFFMHCLINSQWDVELLRRRGIIKNCAGNDEEVCMMFSRLGRNILVSSSFSYSQLCSSMNEHCRRHRVKKWRANLRTNYFNRPWTMVSFLAAFALLILTFIQTTYTMLAYYNHSR